jgi:hypothetical protein
LYIPFQHPEIADLYGKIEVQNIRFCKGIRVEGKIVVQGIGIGR